MHVKLRLRIWNWNQYRQNNEFWVADRLVFSNFDIFPGSPCWISSTCKNAALLHILDNQCYNMPLLTTMLYLFLIVSCANQLILTKNLKKNRCVSICESQVIYEGSYCAHPQRRTHIYINTLALYAHYANVFLFPVPTVLTTTNSVQSKIVCSLMIKWSVDILNWFHILWTLS